MKDGESTREEKSFCERRKDVGVYLKKISERLQAYADKKGYGYDVTYAQGKVLFFLHAHAGGECSMKEIETYFDVSHATVSGIISRLAEKGYVTCEKKQSGFPRENGAAHRKRIRFVRRDEAPPGGYRNHAAERFFRCGKGNDAKNLERIYQNVREVTAEPTKDADKEVKANK